MPVVLLVLPRCGWVSSTGGTMRCASKTAVLLSLLSWRLRVPWLVSPRSCCGGSLPSSRSAGLVVILARFLLTSSVASASSSTAATLVFCFRALLSPSPPLACVRSLLLPLQPPLLRNRSLRRLRVSCWLVATVAGVGWGPGVLRHSCSLTSRKLRSSFHSLHGV